MGPLSADTPPFQGAMPDNRAMSALPPTIDDSAPWQHDTPVRLSPRVQRLTAPNAGVMTGPGTNSYLIGTPQTGFVVVDPGPMDTDHIQRLWQACPHPDGSGGHIVHIVCTHSHADHAPAARPLQALCPQRPPVWGLPSAPTARANSQFTPDQSLQNEELITLIPCGPEANLALNSVRLRAIHTPGHAANHLCLLLEEEALLFSGDHILNGSTTVIDPPDGHMGDYLHSLDTLSSLCEAHGVRYILPAHGNVLDGALATIAKLKAHRLQREAKVLAAMQALPKGSPKEWVPLAYDDVDARLWPLAQRSLLAHVEHLQELQQAPTP
ncbi:MAG: MBL fold metallo-hydrolase [Rhodoferax sp.]|nr:MAG: MBL fold metallo-hydrolase [Rhodoferax sp.]